MENQPKKFEKLSVKKIANIFFRQEPMAQIAVIQKKLKKNKKTKPSELAEMYNEKCISLCEQIENGKIEIENYKTIIFELQKTLVDKEKEIETLKLDLLKEKDLVTENEEKIKSLRSSMTQDQILAALPQESDIFQQLQNKIILLNKEKNEFNLKLIDMQNDCKAILKEKEEKIIELQKNIENLKKNGNVINDNDEKKEEEKKIEVKDEIKDVKVEKEETEEHKLMNFNRMVTENLFLTYLLERSCNYGKTIKELVTNFDKYSNIFIRDNLKVNNIFSSILYEFVYRCYRRINLEEFAQEIYDNNSINAGEDFKTKLTEVEFFTKGYVNDYHIQELNKKIRNYKVEVFENIRDLAKKCQEFIKDTPALENVRKFDPNSLYTLTKTRLKINLTNLTPNTIGYLVTSVKYLKSKIKSIEFTGDLNYDRNEECKYTHELFYQLLVSHGDEIKELYFTSIKKFTPYKLLSLSYSTNFFIKGINILLQGCPNIKNVYVTNCEITDDHLNDFEFKLPSYKYGVINFSNNKIYKLKSFENISATQLVLNHNKIKFYQGDNKLSFTYLDISANDFKLKDFNAFMSESSIQILNISDIRIAKEDEGNLVANTLSSIRDLKIIYLNNCQIQERSLKPITTALAKSEILELYLSNNPLGNECMKLLSEFIGKCQSLLKVDIGNTKITIDGLQDIVEGVTDNEAIKEVIVENNPMLEKGKVEELFKFKENFKVTL